MKISKKINDFGEKIGGARKDLARGITLEDLSAMSNMDISKNITKNKIWGKIDYEELVNNGMSKTVAYFVKRVRDALPSKPSGVTPEAAKLYIDFINDFKTSLLDLKTEGDIKNYFDDFLVNKYVHKVSSRTYHPNSEYGDLITSKLFKAVQVPSIDNLISEMLKKQFLLSKDEKARDKALTTYKVFRYKENTKWNFDLKHPCFHQETMFGTYFMYPHGELCSPDKWKEDTWYVRLSCDEFKNNFPTKEAAEEFAINYFKEKQNEERTRRKLSDTVPHLEHIRPSNPSYHGLNTVTTDALQKTFNFRGGEFGNYETIKDRTKNIEFSYDAFCVLAETLNISVKDIPFNNRLAIAYGARGTGGKNAALAHYEPAKRVINLTKLKGAGSLAHEWMHALDHYLCNLELPNVEKGLTSEEIKASKYMLSNNEYSNNIMTDLLQTMKFQKTKMCESDDPRYNRLITKEKIHLQRAVREFDYKIKEDKITTLEGILKEFQNSPLEFDDYRALNDDSIKSAEELHPAITKLMNDLSKITGETITKDDGRLNSIVYDQANLTDMKRRLGQKEITVPTKFFDDARTLDVIFGHARKIYYSSNEELLARAFACYVHDKLVEKGQYNDYLCGHSDIQSWFPDELGLKSQNSEKISISPMGEERKLINKEFDKLFEKLKEKEIFADFNIKEVSLFNQKSLQKNDSQQSKKSTVEKYGHVEQMSIFDFDLDK